MDMFSSAQQCSYIRSGDVTESLIALMGDGMEWGVELLIRPRLLSLSSLLLIVMKESVLVLYSSLQQSCQD